jgi:surfeit locus 1 family protein
MIDFDHVCFRRSRRSSQRSFSQQVHMFFRTIPGLGQTFRRRLHGSARLKLWFLNPSKKSVPTIYKARQEPWLTPTMVLLGVMPIFTFALGTWQLKRLKWKINLIDELEEKLHSQPLQLPPSIKFSTISSNPVPAD